MLEINFYYNNFKFYKKKINSCKRKLFILWKLVLGYGKQGVCHTVALPFTLKSILRQMKNHRNLYILPFKNIIFKKSSERNQNPSRYYKSVTNIKFQHKPKYYLSKILI